MLGQLADRISLQRQITLFAGAIGLFIVGATTAGSALLASGQATDMARNALLQVARSVADRLDQDMAERLRETVQQIAAALLGKTTIPSVAEQTPARPVSRP